MITKTKASKSTGAETSKPAPPPEEVVDLAELLPGGDAGGCAGRSAAGGDHRPGRAGRPARRPGDRDRPGRRAVGAPRLPARPGAAGNVRNGSTTKTLKTELGEVPIKTPRDRAGNVRTGPRRAHLGLYAGCMAVRDIECHLSDLYGVEIKRDTISQVPDAVMEDVEAWRTRPLEAVYPIGYFDALMVTVRDDRSVRTRACYLAIGVTVEGRARAARDLVAAARGPSCGSPCSTTSTGAASRTC